jgi:hypothetical protein
MVKIELTKKDNLNQKLHIYGHANAGEYNQDLVCAAITGIVTGALNAFDIDYHNDVELIVKENDIQIIVKNLKNQELQEVFKFLLKQLETMTVQYPQNAILKEVN